jgi:hypothetical protein
MSNPLRVCLIGNLSDRRCGFQNVTQQMITALERTPAVDLTVWDGTYSAIYARQQEGDTGFFPLDILDGRYDVVHLIWNAMTMNHYTGARWQLLLDQGIVTSWWDGGPSDASCPFIDFQQVRWSDYPREGYTHLDYPVPDWIDHLPSPDPVFTVGASSVRGDGIAEIQYICESKGWAMNLPTPGNWLSVEDEIRRLARSTVNVCWYRTPPLWLNRASAPSMLLASHRPLLINRDLLVAHLWDDPEIYHETITEFGGRGLEAALVEIARDPEIRIPRTAIDRMSWTHAAETFVSVWKDAHAARA